MVSSQSLAALPLRVDGRTIGAIGARLLQRASVRPLGARLPHRARAALRPGARACAALRGRASSPVRPRSTPRIRMARLQELTAACSEALTPQEVAQAVLTHGRAALHSVSGLVALIDAHRPSARGRGRAEAVARGRRTHSQPPPRRSDHPLTEAIRQRTPLWLGRASEARAQFPQFAELCAEGEQAWAVLPLVHGGKMTGSVLFGFETPRAFTQVERLVHGDAGAPHGPGTRAHPAHHRARTSRRGSRGSR